MSENKALVSVEQREVEFYGDELTAVKAENGRVFVSITQMCNALGLDTQAQRRRMERHDVLARGLGVANLATPGGVQSTYVLRVDLVPLWLSGVRANAVNEVVRPKLIRFQEEAAAVLWEAFADGRLTADPDFATILNQVDEGAAQAYQIAAAVYQIARNQVMLEARLTGRMDSHEARLEAIESQLGAPDHVITQSQAMQISQAVKAVAIAYGKQTGKNEFGGVYGELYRKFEIASYKALPAVKFDDCMKWLTEWHQGLVNENPF